MVIIYPHQILRFMKTIQFTLHLIPYKKFIDEDIFYDKVANKVIITTSDNVLKFKFDDKKVSKNLEYVDFKNPMKLVSKEAYIPLSELKDI